MHFRSFSKKRNINALVTVTVTEEATAWRVAASQLVLMP